MKKINIFYWTFTALFAAFMIFSSVGDVVMAPEAVTFMTHLGYPLYFIPFIGVAKLLGVIAILIPGFPRIKEWAYAGLFFDLTGATYSLISIGEPAASWSFMALPFALGIGSYVFYHKRLKASVRAREISPEEASSAVGN